MGSIPSLRAACRVENVDISYSVAEITDRVKELAMIRVYFVFEDPLDDDGVNLSFIDVRTRDPREAFQRVERAADSGELWRNMYPDDLEHPYTLIRSKMTYLDISLLPEDLSGGTIFAADGV